MLRLAADLPDDETEKSLAAMREKLDTLVASLAKRRPARGPAQDTREAIDVILTHIDNHGENLWGHAICLPKSAGGGVKIVARTNIMAESFFKMLKHDERRRSGRKNLGQDLEHLHAEAALVRNLEHNDYMRIVCGSIDRLPATFAEMDKRERQKRLNGGPIKDQEDDLKTILQLASASLSPADRRIVRGEKMNRRIEAAARSRAPRRRYGTPARSNPTGS